ncbi:MAG: YbaB/EbfC family nucleoid-associated protein, partial [Patescibacteria group bacterium]
MFDKIRQGVELIKLQAKAKKLQKELQEVTATVAKNGIEVRVRGDQKVDSIKIEGEERRDLMDLINDAM